MMHRTKQNGFDKGWGVALLSNVDPGQTSALVAISYQNRPCPQKQQKPCRPFLLDSFRDTDRVDADIIVETIDDDFAVAVVEAVTMGDADDGDSAFVMLIRTMLTHSVPLIDLHSATPGIDAPGLSYPYHNGTHIL